MRLMHDQAHTKPNPRLPAMHWFQHPPEGLTLFLVLLTKRCQWARCIGCSLPRLGVEEPIGFGDLFQQTDYVFRYLLSPAQKTQLTKIILSNNGSVFDERTLSTTALLYFVAQMNLHCPNIKVLSLETRAEHVELDELLVLERAIHEGPTPTALEIAIGFEAFDSTLRNQVFKKGLSLETFEKLTAMLAAHGFSLKCYFMLKPVPNLSDEAAIGDIHEAIRYLDQIARRESVVVNMHLNPTYVAVGSELAAHFEAGTYRPPTLLDTCRAVLPARDTAVSVFVGLNDEGLAVPGGSFLRPEEAELVEPIERFNETQDFSILERIVG